MQEVSLQWKCSPSTSMVLEAVFLSEDRLEHRQSLMRVRGLLPYSMGYTEADHFAVVTRYDGGFGSVDLRKWQSCHFLQITETYNDGKEVRLNDRIATNESCHTAKHLAGEFLLDVIFAKAEMDVLKGIQIDDELLVIK